MRKLQTKPGEHGTLYRYAIVYTDDDPGFGVAQWRTWAYSREHAIEKFDDDDQGLKPLRIANVHQDTTRLIWSDV